MGSAGWHVVDGNGHDPATGRAPAGHGAPSAAAALARVPVGAWPVRAVSGDGAALAVGDVLGPGGGRVEQILARLATAAPPPRGWDVAALARATPAGSVGLPVVVVDLAAAAADAAAVDRTWMSVVEARRVAPRDMLLAHGRGLQLEAALNLTMLVATGSVDDGEAARVASGARLWLLGGAVAWALLDDADDPFAAWAEIVSHGLWPVGPARGRLVVCDLAVKAHAMTPACTAGTDD